LDSFRPGTHPGDVSLGSRIGGYVVSSAAELVLERVGGKAIGAAVHAVDGKRGGGNVGSVGAKGNAQRLPSSLPENLTGYANPADIKFTQNSVSNTFKDGQSLQTTIDGLKSGKISPDALPPIRVFEKDGVIYSLDNRRLLAVSQAGVPIKIVPATQAEVVKEAWKMTNPNGGEIICARGSCSDLNK
ncbi:MAG TPA: hypothetical protein VGE28_10915, partial [Pseudomonas sp.]